MHDALTAAQALPHTGQATPARVQGRHTAPLWRGQQERQAIGHHHHTAHPGLGGAGAIGHRRHTACRSADIGRGQSHHAVAVHLLQPHRWRAQVVGEGLSVALHRLRIVLNVIAQVASGEHALAHATGARAHQADHRCCGVRPDQGAEVRAHPAWRQRPNAVVGQGLNRRRRHGSSRMKDRSGRAAAGTVEGTTAPAMTLPL